jgi:hypothetical protein
MERKQTDFKKEDIMAAGFWEEYQSVNLYKGMKALS